MINDLDENTGNNLLHFAIDCKKPEIFDIIALVINPTCFNDQNIDGDTPLIRAVFTN